MARARGGAAGARALAAPTPARSLTGHVEALGGRTTGTRRLALMRAGLDPAGRVPASGSADYRAYRSARRSIERGLRFESGAGGETRRPSESAIRDEQARVRAVATRERLTRIRRRGLRARMRVKLQVSADVRWRVIPAPPGAGVLLSSEATNRIVDDAMRGDLAGAGRDLPREVVRAWGKGEASFSIVEVGWARVWPDGEEEPG